MAALIFTPLPCPFRFIILGALGIKVKKGSLRSCEPLAQKMTIFNLQGDENVDLCVPSVTDRQTNWRMDRQTDGLNDKWTDRWTDGQTYGLTDIWINLVLFGPIKSNLNQFGAIRSDFIQFWTNLIQFEQIWSILIQFRQIWSTLNQFDLIWTNLPIWTNLIHFDPWWPLDLLDLNISKWHKN